MFRVRTVLIVLVLALAGQPAEGQSARHIDVVVSAPTANGGQIILKTVVPYDDLDISTAVGASALLDRISTSATHACAKRRNEELPRVPAGLYEACARRGVANAVQTLDAPEVTRAFNHRNS